MFWKSPLLTSTLLSPVYQNNEKANASALDSLFVMATYSDIHDHLHYEKVLVARALQAGIAPSQMIVGLGSVSVASPSR